MMLVAWPDGGGVVHVILAVRLGHLRRPERGGPFYWRQCSADVLPTSQVAGAKHWKRAAVKLERKCPRAIGVVSLAASKDERVGKVVVPDGVFVSHGCWLVTREVCAKRIPL